MPDFIRALLEHVGTEINPIRLIRRIKDGMEIPGLQAALITIVHSSHLQVGSISSASLRPGFVGRRLLSDTEWRLQRPRSATAKLPDARHSGFA
jgi:hypothetical protein